MIGRLFVRIGTLIRYLTTSKDNRTPSLIRILALFLGGNMVWLAPWAVVVNKQDFDVAAYGTGVSLLLAGLGVALRVALPTSAGNDKKDAG